MKALILTLALLCAPALATTERVHPLPQTTSSATSTGGNPVATASTGNAYGGAAGSAQVASGDTSLYVLPAPIAGSNLPAGMCQRSRYSHRAFVWNFVSLADGDSHTDLECLRLLAELERLRAQPMPKPVVEILTSAPAVPPPPVCALPAKAKSVAAAKKAGACR